MSNKPVLAGKFLLDLFLWMLATPLAFCLRLDFDILKVLPNIAFFTLVGLPVKAAIIYGFGFHRHSWRKISFQDPYDLVKGIGLGVVILSALAFMLSPYPHFFVPRSEPFISGILALIMLCGVRFAVRTLDDRPRRHANGEVKRVLLIGASDVGMVIAREMQRHPEGGLVPVGFLDDNPEKLHQRFLGLLVHGAVDDLVAVARQVRAHEVIIAIRSAPGPLVRKVTLLAQDAGINSRIIPSMYDILAGNISLTQTREVDVADLLGRDPVDLDAGRPADYIQGRVVLVTGAGGSIGSEIVRQMIQFKPARIILLGRGEFSLFQLERELERDFPQQETVTVVADVRDRRKLQHVYEKHRPQVVFHAAAHKHVPLMEHNPDEAVFNNVGGTRNVTELALEAGVQRFVNVSTDKAVNPSSIMGASKRLSEYLTTLAGKQAEGDAKFVSVRFGNVLGSRGSVVPIFKEQIRRGGPITITHPEMTRYFKTIPEAAQLVLHAGAIADNGCVYVLDMGKPVKISDLAADLIRLSGLKPGIDIQIKYTGIRPGEKLFEELLLAEEGTVPSKHQKIFIARGSGIPCDGDFDRLLINLFDAAAARDPAAIRSAFQALIPTYNPNPAPSASAPSVSAATPLLEKSNPPGVNLPHPDRSGH